jgi:Fe-S cluster assembly protein SufD
MITQTESKDKTVNVTIATPKSIDFRNIDRGEPEWLYEMRKEAWKIYQETPLPERVTNLWRYSRPDIFLAAQPKTLMDSPSIFDKNSNHQSHPVGAQYAAYGYTRDTITAVAKVAPPLEMSGLIFKELNWAATENEELVRKYLGKLIGTGFGKYEALNMALWNIGFFLYIPDNMVVEKPIRINRHPGGAFMAARLLAVIGKNSEVTIIDDFSGDCRVTDSSANTVTEIFAGDSSRVKYVNLQRLSSQCISYHTERAEIGQGAVIYPVFAGVGGAVSKVNAGTILNGRGADSRMYGIVFGDDKQNFDYHTMHHHKANESTSNINFKVILKDKATSSYTGLIRIEKETANCEAYQENRNLLLNKGTRAESIPELEILADQVRCTHGATMGPIDPEMLFYLRSRGISPDDAVRVVVSGFVEPTISALPNDLQELMRTLIYGKLGGELK